MHSTTLLDRLIAVNERRPKGIWVIKDDGDDPDCPGLYADGDCLIAPAHDYQNYGVNKELLEFIALATNSMHVLLAVVKAAREFKESMAGEWPADRYDDMCKTLEALE